MKRVSDRVKLAVCALVCSLSTLACSGLLTPQVVVTGAPTVRCGDPVADWLDTLEGSDDVHAAARAYATQLPEQVAALLQNEDPSDPLVLDLLAKAHVRTGNADALRQLHDAGLLADDDREVRAAEALIGALAEGGAERVHSASTVVALHSVRPLPVVGVVINGVPARLIVDTGADVLFLGDHLDLPGAVRHGGFPARGGGGGELETELVQVDLELGDLRVEHARAAVAALPPGMAEHADGLLGWSVLRHLRMRIVPGEQMLYIESPSSGAAPTLTDLFQPTVRVWAPDGTPLDLFLDTGKNVSSLHPAGADLLHLETRSAHRTKESVGIAKQTVKAEAVRDLTLHLGSALIAFDAVLVLEDLTVEEHHSQHGLLGWDALAAAHEVIIDGPGGVFELRPPPP